MSTWVLSVAIKDPDTRIEGSRKPGGVRDCKRGCNTGKRPYKVRARCFPELQEMPASRGLRSAGAQPFCLMFYHYYFITYFFLSHKSPGNLTWPGAHAHMCV